MLENMGVGIIVVGDAGELQPAGQLAIDIMGIDSSAFVRTVASEVQEA